MLVFDGSMGANLQTLELTAEDFGGARYEGCMDALCLTPTGRPCPTAPRISERRLRRHRDQHLPGQPLAAAGVGPGRHARYGINFAGAAHRPPRVRRLGSSRTADRGSSPASIGPTGFLPSSDDPTLSNVRFETLVEIFAEQTRGLLEGGADLLIVETQQDILETKAAMIRRAAAFASLGRTRAAAGAGLARHQRPHAARHRRRRGADHSRRPGRRRHRPQLLDRPRAHARANPLPGPEHPHARSASSPTRVSRSTWAAARRSIRSSPTAWPRRSPSSSRTSASTSSAAAAARPSSTCERSSSGSGRRAPRPRADGRLAAARRQLDSRLRPAPEPTADAGRRASQYAGQSQGQAAAAGR